jgi:hypothetical protein
VTYSRQGGVLAGIEPTENIPPGFLRSLNYRDVTKEYWETQNVSIRLSHPLQRTVYACVLNALDWKPIWWGTIRNDSVTFTNMSKGVVYQPMYYIQGKLVPAGFPVAVGYHHSLTLQPDTTHTQTIHLAQQERYLIYRPGFQYKLYYWNLRWRLLAAQTAAGDTRELVFRKVPQNALLLLVPSYSEHKERPFMFTGDGQRVWW